MQSTLLRRVGMFCVQLSMRDRVLPLISVLNGGIWNARRVVSSTPGNITTIICCNCRAIVSVWAWFWSVCFVLVLFLFLIASMFFRETVICKPITISIAMSVGFYLATYSYALGATGLAWDSVSTL